MNILSQGPQPTKTKETIHHQNIAVKVVEYL